MRQSERSAFSSGQNSRPTYIQSQLASGGVGLVRSPLRKSDQPMSAFVNNLNTMAQQPQMRSFNPASGTVTVPNRS